MTKVTEAVYGGGFTKVTSVYIFDTIMRIHDYSLKQIKTFLNNVENNLNLKKNTTFNYIERSYYIIISLYFYTQ